MNDMNDNELLKLKDLKERLKDSHIVLVNWLRGEINCSGVIMHHERHPEDGTKLADLVKFANEIGWDGTENSKDLFQFIKDKIEFPQTGPDEQITQTKGQLHAKALEFVQERFTSEKVDHLVDTYVQQHDDYHEKLGVIIDFIHYVFK